MLRLTLTATVGRFCCNAVIYAPERTVRADYQVPGAVFYQMLPGLIRVFAGVQVVSD